MLNYCKIFHSFLVEVPLLSVKVGQLPRCCEPPPVDDVLGSKSHIEQLAGLTNNSWLHGTSSNSNIPWQLGTAPKNDINQLILYLNDHEATFGSKLFLLNFFQALVFAMWLTSLDQFYKLQNSLFMRSKSRNNQTWELSCLIPT